MPFAFSRFNMNRKPVSRSRDSGWYLKRHAERHSLASLTHDPLSQDPLRIARLLFSVITAPCFCNKPEAQDVIAEVGGDLETASGTAVPRVEEPWPAVYNAGFICFHCCHLLLQQTGTRCRHCARRGEYCYGTRNDRTNRRCTSTHLE